MRLKIVKYSKVLKKKYKQISQLNKVLEENKMESKHKDIQINEKESKKTID